MLAKLKSFSPEFPSLYGSHFKLAAREICAILEGGSEVGTIFSVAGTVTACAHVHTHAHTRIVADLSAQLIGVAVHPDPQLLQLLLHHPTAFSSLGPECVQLSMKGTASPSLWCSDIKVGGGRRWTQALVHVQESLFSIQIPVCPYFSWLPVQLSFPTSGISCKHTT